MFADMAELADALDLGSSVNRRAGSTPVIRTITLQLLKLNVFKGCIHFKVLENGLLLTLQLTNN